MGDVAEGSAASLTAARDRESVTQKAAKKADGFSVGGPIGAEDEYEGDVREATLGCTGNATEFVQSNVSRCSTLPIFG